MSISGGWIRIIIIPPARKAWGSKAPERSRGTPQSDIQQKWIHPKTNGNQGAACVRRWECMARLQLLVPEQDFCPWPMGVLPTAPPHEQGHVGLHQVQIDAQHM
ncbi:hypothetical protein Y032_0002g1131 [Ancylostoma ceylanicum]|uniref:Uncharacterized protein n=1 Tax=Ancylostoma ceylanicum TaxID=53326 RepID=A0A016W0Q0_9BILA|nr:hypothetical protein Y032_0002g1131 [Ancylostoma ceylanicum]